MTDLSPLRHAINQAYLCDETSLVNSLLDTAQLSNEISLNIAHQARDFILEARERIKHGSGIDALLHEYDLSSQEGVVLMCVAEALLRIPDTTVADQLIKDKLGYADWEKHLGKSHSLFVNATTWGLMLTGKVLRYEHETMSHGLTKLLSRGSDPIIRRAIHESMQIIGHQFVLGETISDALLRSQMAMNQEYLFSYDMLGESALTMKDAEKYYEQYMNAIKAISDSAIDASNEFVAPGISVKLTALHPRVELTQKQRVMNELVPKVLKLAQQAYDSGISMTIDAEEANRLELTLDVYEAVYKDKSLGDWNGLGLAVQAYQKRAIPVIDWLQQLASDHHKKMMIRLVKGAYWDSEIKYSQEQGHVNYPVFTRKVNTDISYQACVNKILTNIDYFYPQFATHNAYTVATIQSLAKAGQDYEFQRLHGMGEALYDYIKEEDETVKCRVYAPVGNHKDLLPYLVRRLLENGSNSSFVNRIENDRLPVDELITNPVSIVKQLDQVPHPSIPTPGGLFGEQRQNSTGFNFSDPRQLKLLEDKLSQYKNRKWRAKAVIDEISITGTPVNILSPIDNTNVIGELIEATEEQARDALAVAYDYYKTWSNTEVEERALFAEKAADLLEDNRYELIYLCASEGGRCIKDALSEVREAIDACRYYANEARRIFSKTSLPGPTGESNQLSLHGRGVACCISPWNFPVAIFTGQVIAALVSGNTVIAKPSNLTAMCGMRVIELLHEAGFPKKALCYLPLKGSSFDTYVLSDSRVASVIFTGSNKTASLINTTLANRPGPIASFIAETGGQNAMIVDSSALPEQVVNDVLVSAFNSAGQRCSALRILYLQNDIADRVIDLLKGAVEELKIADPLDLATDVGPIIDTKSKTHIQNHIDLLKSTQKLICEADVPVELLNNNYIKPTIFEIESIDVIREEIFGPVLHIIRYHANSLDHVINSINNTGYGLTLGIHTRINEKAEYIAKNVNAGNIYINRNMIGAVIESQPFGGVNLSGTGPKAGGPHYLLSLVTEKTVTNNLAAIGGNTSLINLND